MVNRGRRSLLGAASYLGICGGICALAFLGEFAVPIPMDVTAQWPLMHASTADFGLPPGDSRRTKE
jgi:hypothetical protein